MFVSIGNKVRIVLPDEVQGRRRRQGALKALFFTYLLNLNTKNLSFQPEGKRF
jgi:hypothetical protein